MTAHDDGPILLVAPPDMSDPNFAGTVVLVLAYNPGGAFGLVVNRPHPLELALVLPNWALVATLPVLEGGPVESDSLIGLAQPKPGMSPDGFTPLATSLTSLGTVDLHREPSDAFDRVRIFAGYSGWGPGQLDGEIAVGGWLIVAAHPDDPFTADLEGLWGRVLRRHHGHRPLLAQFPDDLSAN